jgi:hypothetical protein
VCDRFLAVDSPDCQITHFDREWETRCYRCIAFYSLVPAPVCHSQSVYFVSSAVLCIISYTLYLNII